MFLLALYVAQKDLAENTTKFCSAVCSYMVSSCRRGGYHMAGLDRLQCADIPDFRDFRLVNWGMVVLLKNLVQTL